MSVGRLSSTHLLVLPVSNVIIPLSQSESTDIRNCILVSDGSENLPSKDLATLSVRILLDGLSVGISINE